MTAVKLNARSLRAVYQRLFETYGPQHWWPGDTPFEIMVGSVLTQNTAWVNVERAIQNLKAEQALSAEKILATPHEQLAEWLRPSGYFNIKAKRLRNFCDWYLAGGKEQRLANLGTQDLREQVLSVNGVGPETADDILLYAFERPVFVIDAYTRRLFSRLGMIAGDESYESLRLGFERALGPDTLLFNEYHALIVRHAKQHCSVKPRCERCSLIKRCNFS